MKTPEELYEEIIKNVILRQKLAEAAGDEEISAFLKDQGCHTTPEAFGRMLREKAHMTGTVNEETIMLILDDIDFCGFV